MLNDSVSDDHSVCTHLGMCEIYNEAHRRRRFSGISRSSFNCLNDTIKGLRFRIRPALCFTVEVRKFVSAPESLFKRTEGKYLVKRKWITVGYRAVLEIRDVSDEVNLCVGETLKCPLKL